jgi:hypothetical protein
LVASVAWSMTTVVAKRWFPSTNSAQDRSALFAGFTGAFSWVGVRFLSGDQNVQRGSPDRLQAVRSAMRNVAEITAINGHPGLVAFDCASCGITHSVLRHPGDAVSDKARRMDQSEGRQSTA